MAGHVRRFNPSHQWVHKRIAAGELKIQQMDVQTYFFRRTNMNALGQPRSWTDHLLWHHACPHRRSVPVPDRRSRLRDATPCRGRSTRRSASRWTWAIGLKVPSGAICTLSLSFNNNGPLGTFFRYICDNGTYIARYDDLYDGKDNKIDLSGVAVSMQRHRADRPRVRRRDPRQARAQRLARPVPARHAHARSHREGDALRSTTRLRRSLATNRQRATGRAGGSSWRGPGLPSARKDRRLVYSWVPSAECG